MNIRVGILTAPKIEFEQRENSFVLHNVRIGIGFHWDRCEDQEFAGRLEILHNPDGTKTAVNIIDLEDYLCSVISSEMSANSPLELLKAHAVISRSWAIRAITANQKSKIKNLKSKISFESNGHVGFDVCADDHCQRYEGLARMNERAVEAVRATEGQVLMYKDEICDCRFHKCCGGKTEEFETCWEDIHVPYLESVECPFCNPKYLNDKTLLKQSLNDYDLETADYHDWQVTYTPSELGVIIRDKSGIDFGDIQDLIPLNRGKSGRIYELEIVGSKRRQVIGKELTIRRWLSKSCLYSSWFDVHKSEIINHKSQMSNQFTLIGHGWGHGVGLCQIGAATMATEGYSFEQILAHYYPHTVLARA
ncbi:MAG: SpoIID/LytB domain-containing protein [Paludibacteraceae bacterium]|nr:SpoIID/LytB domain-containing protein [Paludibacteraceae bacterium]